MFKKLTIKELMLIAHNERKYYRCYYVGPGSKNTTNEHFRVKSVRYMPRQDQYELTCNNTVILANQYTKLLVNMETVHD